VPVRIRPVVAPRRRVICVRPRRAEGNRREVLARRVDSVGTGRAVLWRSAISARSVRDRKAVLRRHAHGLRVRCRTRASGRPCSSWHLIAARPQPPIASVGRPVGGPAKRLPRAPRALSGGSCKRRGRCILWIGYPSVSLQGPRSTVSLTINLHRCPGFGIFKRC
jgi:hypothetical protein